MSGPVGFAMFVICTVRDFKRRDTVLNDLLDCAYQPEREVDVMGYNYPGLFVVSVRHVGPFMGCLKMGYFKSLVSSCTVAFGKVHVEEAGVVAHIIRTLGAGAECRGRGPYKGLCDAFRIRGSPKFYIEVIDEDIYIGVDYGTLL